MQEWIGTSEGARGSMPARGVKSGVRCITRTRLRASALSPIVEWSTWSGLWPRGRDVQHPEVVVSMLPRTERIHRGLVRARDVTAALLPLLLLLALMAGPPLRQAFVIALAGTVVVKAIVAAVGVSWAVHVRADETGKWLLVERLHKDTAAAIQARMAQPETEPALTSETQASQNMSRISASDAG